VARHAARAAARCAAGRICAAARAMRQLPPRLATRLRWHSLAQLRGGPVGTAAWGRPARICFEYREYLRWGGAGPTRTLAKYVPLFRANWTAWATQPPPAWQPAVDAEAAALAAA